MKLAKKAYGLKNPKSRYIKAGIKADIKADIDTDIKADINTDTDIKTGTSCKSMFLKLKNF